MFCDLETNDGFHLTEDDKTRLIESNTNGQERCEQGVIPLDSHFIGTELKEKVINLLDISNDVCTTTEDITKQDKKGKLHIKTESEFKCNECNKVFNRCGNLNWHIKEKHTENVKMSACEICSKEFKYFLINRHMTNVHTKEASACDQCGKIYNNRKNLRDHKRSVHEGLDLLCHLCSKSFKSKSYLSMHVRRIHDFIDEEHSCDFCSKVFKSQNSLYLHNLAVHTVENIPCHKCGKVYKNNYLLKKHIRHMHRI